MYHITRDCTGKNISDIFKALISRYVDIDIVIKKII